MTMYKKSKELISEHRMIKTLSIDFHCDESISDKTHSFDDIDHWLYARQDVIYTTLSTHAHVKLLRTASSLV